MTDLPEWIDEKISVDPNRDVQDRHIVEVFLESERPYLSVNQVRSQIGLSKEQTDDRLKELVEIDVLDSDTIAGGQIFWIRDDQSDWPIPPDIIVAAGKNEMTIREFVTKLYGMYGVVAVGSVMMGALLMTGFTLLLIADLELPLIDTPQLLAFGVLFTLFGIGFLMAAAGVAFWDRYVSR